MTSPSMDERKADDFRVGQHVTYVPHHANGNLSHPDCEHGIVTSLNSVNVFVRFNPLNAHGQACDPSTLVATP